MCASIQVKLKCIRLFFLSLINLWSFSSISDKERWTNARYIAAVLYEVLEAVTNAAGPQVLFVFFLFPSFVYSFFFHSGSSFFYLDLTKH